jgi:hypothetical protein
MTRTFSRLPALPSGKHEACNKPNSTAWNGAPEARVAKQRWPASRLALLAFRRNRPGYRARSMNIGYFLSSEEWARASSSLRR